LRIGSGHRPTGVLLPSLTLYVRAGSDLATPPSSAPGCTEGCASTALPPKASWPHRSAALPSFVDVGVLWGTTAGAPSSGESAASQPQDSLLACRGVGLVVLALKQSFVKDAPLCVCRSLTPFRWRHARNSIKSPCAATHRRRTGWRRWRSRRPDTKAPGTAPMRALGLHLRLATTAHLSDAGILWR